MAVEVVSATEIVEREVWPFDWVTVMVWTPPSLATSPMLVD